MKTVSTIAVFAVIFAGAVGILAVSGISTPLTIAAAPQAESESYMSGHVEYTLRDADGNIKGYWQNDNIVVNNGDDCAANELFEPDQTDICTITADGFSFIKIGKITIS